MLVARHSRRFLPPPLIDEVQRVSYLLVLGVTLEHVERTLEACSRSVYALRELALKSSPPGRQSYNRCEADLCFSSVVGVSHRLLSAIVLKGSFLG